MAGALEYLCCEILDIAGDIALKKGKKIIVPSHINMAFRTDMELSKLMYQNIIAASSVPSNIHPSIAVHGKER